MGIGVVTVKSGLIQSSKKCFLELAFNKNSTPLPKKKKKKTNPGCAICRPHSNVFTFKKNT